jgi:hypothetical protein
VSNASSRGKSAADEAASSDNVITLPLPQRAELASQPMLFTDGGKQGSTPWLIEQQATRETKPGKLKKTATKKAAKKPVAARKGTRVAAKKVKAVAVPKRTTVKRAPAKAKKVVDAAVPKVETVETDKTAPLQRAMAPVVWRKTGPIDVVRFWLRSAGMSMKAMLGPRAGLAATGSVADPRLRTRKELLAEVAVLRQENAAMRKKLGLPVAPFGRLVADRI